MAECPCRKCYEREIGCHAVCGRFKAWRADLDEKNEIARAKREETYTFDRFGWQQKKKIRERMLRGK